LLSPEQGNSPLVTAVIVTRAYVVRLTLMPLTTPASELRTSPWGRLGFAPRRATSGYSVPAEELGQPQDGGGPSDEALASNAGSAAFREPEDARLTGGTRSLMRRVLGLNVTSSVARPLRPLAVRPSKPLLGTASAA
jgi:hypothetical protein